MARSSQSAVITAQIKQLLPLVRMASGIVERRNAMPILGHLLLKSEDGRLVAVGTKGTDQINASCETGGLSESAMMTVPALQIQSILSNFGAETEVRLETAKESVKLTAGSSSFTMPSCDPLTFPLQSSDVTGITFSLTSRQLRKMLSETAFAIAFQDVRAYLNGALFEVEEQTLNVVATDTYRLAVSTVKLDNLPLDKTIHAGIVPRGTVVQLLKMLPETDDIVEIVLGEEKTLFKWQGVEFITSMLEGKYPAYRRVIPTEDVNNRSVTVKRDALVLAVSQAALFADDKKPGMAMELTRNLMTFTYRSEANETSSVRIECEWPHEDLTMGFNSKFFMSALTAVGTKNLVLHFGANTSPLLLTKGEDDDGYRSILMPCRL